MLEREKFIYKEMNNLNLLGVVNSYIEFWSKLSEDEVELIMKIPLGIYEKKINYKEIRWFIKKIVWKTAMYVWKAFSIQSNIISTKQLMLFCRFGSNWKSGKSNFLQQMSNKALMEIYRIENNMPEKCCIDDDQLEFLKRFHVKKLFWDGYTGGATKEAITELWDLINKDKVDKLQGSKWKMDPITIKYEKERLAESIGLEAAEEFW
jgi:hypothetical protein